VLFDLRPKQRREDIFDRKKEFEELERSISTYPMTLLLGIRRLAKARFSGHISAGTLEY